MDENTDDNVKKKLFRFAWEKLELQCEYDGCVFVSSSTESFASHIGQCHLSQLTDDDLQCHWKDCEASVCSSQELSRHILLHAHHTKTKCHGKNLQIRDKLPECILGYQNRNLVSKMPDPFQCCWGGCLENFNNPAMFYRHVNMHISGNAGEPKPLKCYWSKCQKTFMDPYKLKDHVKGHSKEKVVACPVCGTVFASRTKFADHLLRQVLVTNTSTTETYSCEYCPKKLPTERLLKEHTRTHVCHYKCPKCDMTCPTPSMLRAHVSYRHSDAKSHACQYCDYKCKRKGDLRKHLDTHNDISPYSCPVEGCDYSSRSQTCFKHHTNAKHGSMGKPKYQCHVCDKLLTRGNYLTKHMADKHNINWPDGHTRFRYNLEDDGFYRLQTVRYESTDMREAVLDDERDPDEPSNSRNVENAGDGSALEKRPAPEGVTQTSQPDPPEQCAIQVPVSNTMPMRLFAENSNGEVSECTVALQGTVTDIILVTPDGKECDPMSLW